MARRIWKETKQEPGTAGPGNMLGCCFVSFHFLWAVLCPQAVEHAAVIIPHMEINSELHPSQLLPPTRNLVTKLNATRSSLYHDEDHTAVA